MAVREDICETLLHAVCCMMCADGRVERSELSAIGRILDKAEVSWDSDEINKRIKAFCERIRKEGYEAVVQETCREIRVFKEIGKEDLLRRCLRYIATADHSVHPKEVDLANRFKLALAGSAASSLSADVRPTVRSHKKASQLAEPVLESGHSLESPVIPRAGNVDQQSTTSRSQKAKDKETALSRECKKQQDYYVRLLARKREIDALRPEHPKPPDSCSHGRDPNWLLYEAELEKWEGQLGFWLDSCPLVPPNCGQSCANCGTSDNFLRRYCFHGWKSEHTERHSSVHLGNVKRISTQTTYSGLADFDDLICNRCTLRRWRIEVAALTVASALYVVAGILVVLHFATVFDALESAGSHLMHVYHGLPTLVKLPVWLVGFLTGITIALTAPWLLPFIWIASLIGVFAYFWYGQERSGTHLAIKCRRPKLRKQGYLYFAFGRIGKRFEKDIHRMRHPPPIPARLPYPWEP